MIQLETDRLGPDVEDVNYVDKHLTIWSRLAES